MWVRLGLGGGHIADGETSVGVENYHDAAKFVFDGTTFVNFQHVAATSLHGAYKFLGRGSTSPTMNYILNAKYKNAVPIFDRAGGESDRQDGNLNHMLIDFDGSITGGVCGRGISPGSSSIEGFLTSDECEFIGDMHMSACPPSHHYGVLSVSWFDGGASTKL